MWFTYTDGIKNKWMAGYRAKKEDKYVQVVIDDVESDECPRSIMLRNPQVEELVMTFNRAQILPGSLGVPYRWPGAFSDVFEILTTQREIDKHAMLNAK